MGWKYHQWVIENKVTLTNTLNIMNYTKYCEQCKGNYISMMDDEQIFHPNERNWASIGNSGPFLWFAGAVYYDSSIHTIDHQKGLHNANNRSLYSNPTYLLDIINNSEAFNDIIRFPYVVNTEASYYGTATGLDKLTFALNSMLKRFFEQEGDDVFYDIHESGDMSVNADVVRGKDLILCYPFGDDKTIEGLYRIGNSLMMSDLPNSIVGIFFTRIIPSVDGTYPIINMADFP